MLLLGSRNTMPAAPLRRWWWQPQATARTCLFFASLWLMVTGTTAAPDGILNFLQLGGIPDLNDEVTCRANSDLLSHVLQHNASHHRLIFPSNVTFHFVYGVYANHVQHAVIQVDGVVRFERYDRADLNFTQPFPSCWTLDQCHNITFTSTNPERGLIDGRGPQWWGVPAIGYLQTQEDRPRLLRLNQTSNVLLENLILQDSPYHTLYLSSCHYVEVRDLSIIARRTQSDHHGWVDLTAFNTDGIDVSGSHVHVHDVDIWVQDDCIAVKDDDFTFAAHDMLFENINASGLGLVVGSILGSRVSNITFRNSFLYKPVKGLYMKFARPNDFYVDHNHADGRIENVLYENITMEQPSQWPIWLGPAQQADDRNPCHPNPCSLCWPMAPTAQCKSVQTSQFVNITLRDIVINNPQMSPGVIKGAAADHAMQNVVFDNVVVTHGDALPRAKLPLKQTFPGRRQPIHDPYVPSGTTTTGSTTDGGGGRRDKDDSPRHLQGLRRYISYPFSRDMYDRHPGSDVTDPASYRVSRIDQLPHELLSVSWLVVVVLGWYLYRQRQAKKEHGAAVESGGLGEPLLGAPAVANPFSFCWFWLELSMWSRIQCGMYGIVLCIVTWMSYLVFALHWNPFKPKWDNTNAYYMCQDVSGGVARGKSWPVPDCFADETEHGWFVVLGNGRPAHPFFVAGLWLTALALLMVTLAWWQKKSHIC